MPGVGGGRAAGGNPRRGGAEAQPEEPRKQRAEVVPEAFQKLQVMRRGRLEAGKGAGKRGRQGGAGERNKRRLWTSQAGDSSFQRGCGGSSVKKPPVGGPRVRGVAFRGVGHAQKGCGLSSVRVGRVMLFPRWWR